ncbi:MAG: RIP metalloprotease RseP [Bacteroidetes bacterium]|nr:RIP metalloprotease RseP [Bacteroidota bacterium]MCZ2132964.1 RIP metalloprotease RseP [Bacteroidota bacterium]
MEILGWIWQFVKVIAIIVAVHEFGHFIAARLCGMRADIFALGMGPRLFGWNKKTKFTFGKLPETWESDGFTDYRLCLLPIGGYVKIAGMVDESLDAEQMRNTPKPWEFRSKNAAQKAFVLSAGVIMNFLLAIAIFAMLAYSNGKTTRLATPVGYVEKNSIAESGGFAPGDKILEINGKACKTANEIQENLLLKNMGDDRNVSVERNGQIIALHINGKQLVDAMSEQKKLGLYFSGSQVIITPADGSVPAAKAGILAEDTLLAINNNPIFSSEQSVEIIGANKNNPIILSVKRAVGIRNITVTPNSDGKIGVALTEKFTGKVLHEDYSFGGAIMQGAEQTYNYVALTGNVVKNIFVGKVSAGNTISGPVGMVKMAGQQAKHGFEAFLSFVAILSVSIALMNILPLPALDGGHLVIVAIEAAIRRELSLKVKIIVQNIGVALLLTLLVVASYNDIMRLLQH